MNRMKARLPNGKQATYHGTSHGGFVYSGGRRVYGRASWVRVDVDRSELAFEPSPRALYAHLVQPVQTHTGALAGASA